MKRYADLLADALRRVPEIQPWDLRERLARDAPPLLLDVREPEEFALARIPGSINVPRGVLEQACEWDYDETVPELAGRRVPSVVVVCRSGNRSVLAADVLRQMGVADAVSLKTGVRGWNDFEQPLVDGAGRAVDGDEAERLLAPRVRPEQKRPL
jgi:rhodanese-related sulfurtransferase